MKTILAAVLAALSLGTAQAVEYVTLTERTPSLQVSPNDVVELVGGTLVDGVPIWVNYTFADGTVAPFYVGGEGTTNNSNNLMHNHKFSGLTAVSFRPNQGNNIAVCFKITRAAEINAVTPSAVLVLPENSTGNFDVVIEASDDLISWLPFFSQTVNSQTAKKFFRTRVVRSEAPVQKP